MQSDYTISTDASESPRAGAESTIPSGDMADVEHEGQFYRIPRALLGALQSSADHAR
jgi:hypothetical protein